MTKRSALFPSLLLTLCVLVAGACGSDDEACADDTCERSEPDQTSEPSTPEPPRVPCLPVCEALIGDCGDSTDVRAMSACIDWCESGGVTADEADCLAGADCQSASSCLGA
jgi:hypothetical protein